VHPNLYYSFNGNPITALEALLKQRPDVRGTRTPNADAEWEGVLASMDQLIDDTKADTMEAAEFVAFMSLGSSYVVVADRSIDAIARPVFDKCQANHIDAYREAIANWKGIAWDRKRSSSTSTASSSRASS
jgi:hypothetical protein